MNYVYRLTKAIFRGRAKGLILRGRGDGAGFERVKNILESVKGYLEQNFFKKVQNLFPSLEKTRKFPIIAAVYAPPLRELEPVGKL